MLTKLSHFRTKFLDVKPGLRKRDLLLSFLKMKPESPEELSFIYNSIQLVKEWFITLMYNKTIASTLRLTKAIKRDEKQQLFYGYLPFREKNESVADGHWLWVQQQLGAWRRILYTEPALAPQNGRKRRNPICQM